MVKLTGVRKLNLDSMSGQDSLDKGGASSFFGSLKFTLKSAERKKEGSMY